ncbi:hypothetical protein IAT40_001663 [Kwoniella sp. CBS 6097]
MHSSGSIEMDTMNTVMPNSIATSAASAPDGTSSIEKGKSVSIGCRQHGPSSVHCDRTPTRFAANPQSSQALSGTKIDSTSDSKFVRFPQSPQPDGQSTDQVSEDDRYSKSSELESGVGASQALSVAGSSAVTERTEVVRPRHRLTGSSSAKSEDVNSRKSDASRSNKACLLTICYLGLIAGGVGLLQYHVGPGTSESNGTGTAGVGIDLAEDHSVATPTSAWTSLPSPEPSVAPSADNENTHFRWPEGDTATGNVIEQDREDGSGGKGE